MARYIDAEQAKTFFEEIDAGSRTHTTLLTPYEFAEYLDEIPTADVVEVVRCNNCAVPHNQWTGCPKLNGLVTPTDFYCSYGERRKEDG
ncbi:MAG: hypothetical protein KIG53_06050 [Oscillospiraceae bacterium]|nr:hypothetical protein [Oscillospiraceae bacterium]